jgi:hypothetical protein
MNSLGEFDKKKNRDIIPTMTKQEIEKIEKTTPWELIFDEINGEYWLNTETDETSFNPPIIDK